MSYRQFTLLVVGQIMLVVMLLVAGQALAQDSEPVLNAEYRQNQPPVDVQPWPVQQGQVIYWNQSALAQLCNRLDGRFSKIAGHPTYRCQLAESNHPQAVVMIVD